MRARAERAEPLPEGAGERIPEAGDMLALLAAAVVRV